MRRLDSVPALCVCVCARVICTHCFNVEHAHACTQNGNNKTVFLKPASGEPVCEAAAAAFRRHSETKWGGGVALC